MPIDEDVAVIKVWVPSTLRECVFNPLAVQDGWKRQTEWSCAGNGLGMKSPRPFEPEEKVDCPQKGVARMRRHFSGLNAQVVEPGLAVHDTDSKVAHPFV